MFRVSIKNKEGIETNASEFMLYKEAVDWIEHNHDYFPKMYTSEIINIAQVKSFDNARKKGLKNQITGREVLAIIYAINDERIKLGLLSQESLAALLGDKNLQIIERLLLNGSLGSATQMIMNSPDSYFNAENKQLILNYINENK